MDSYFSEKLNSQVSDLKKSDNGSFESIVKEYMPVLKNRATFFTKYGTEYEDLVQEGLVALYSAFVHYDDGRNASFKTFALHCVNNRMISYMRRAGNSCLFYGNNLSISGDELGRILSSADFEPEQIFVDNESFERSKREFYSVLSDYEKNILTLYISRYSYSDIAKKFSVSPKSVDNALQRIKRKLKTLKKQPR